MLVENEQYVHVVDMQRRRRVYFHLSDFEGWEASKYFTNPHRCSSIVVNKSLFIIGCVRMEEDFC